MQIQFHRFRHGAGSKNEGFHARGFSGFSLIEVLVALGIFSVGLGGLSLMLLTAVHGTVEARNQTTAALQARNLAELILLNPTYLGHYINPPSTGFSCESGEPCGASDWAAVNLEAWQQELEQSLAGATGLVCRDGTPIDGESIDPACDGDGLAVVKVFWNEPHHVDDALGGDRRIILPVMD